MFSQELGFDQERYAVILGNVSRRIPPAFLDIGHVNISRELPTSAKATKQPESHWIVLRKHKITKPTPH